MNKFSIKEKEMSMLSNFYEQCMSRKEDIMYEYVDSGEEKQSTTWRGELLWEDEEKTIPKMEPIFVKQEKKELSEDDKQTVEAMNNIITKLEKFL